MLALTFWEWAEARIRAAKGEEEEEERHWSDNLAADEDDVDDEEYEDEDGEPVLVAPSRKRQIIRKAEKRKESRRERREAQPVLPVFSAGDYELPPLNLLSKTQYGPARRYFR